MMRNNALEKIVKQVKHVYEHVPYYRNLMDKKGVTPEDIKNGKKSYKLAGTLMKFIAPLM